MATNEQVRQFMTAQPFQQFLVKTVSGRVFTIRHPENIACSVNGREAAVFDEDGMHLVDMLLIEVIEPASTPASPEGNGD